nr:hypothetical protein HK105_004949 [Polyrhizophydium stewartii]
MLTAHVTSHISHHTPLQPDSPIVQDFLKSFHLNRIGVRLLMGHIIALNRPLGMPRCIGILSRDTRIDEIVAEALHEADDVCMATYDVVPDVHLVGDGRDAGFFYVPSHLQHILFETLKNAMRAVIEAEEARVGRGNASRNQMPPIIVSWEHTPDKVRVTVADGGPGFPPDRLARAFVFHSSTDASILMRERERPTSAGPRPWDNDEHDVRKLLTSPPMNGFGYGLPLSRLYAQYLGGDLRIESEPRGGTRVILEMRRFWSDDDVVIPADRDGGLAAVEARK